MVIKEIGKKGDLYRITYFLIYNIYKLIKRQSGVVVKNTVLKPTSWV